MKTEVESERKQTKLTAELQEAALTNGVMSQPTSSTL